MGTSVIRGVVVLVDDKGAPLVCYGCGHSVGGEAYPSRPSGERPCCFCVRNVDPERDARVADLRAKASGPFTARYDNGPTRKEPADQYIATDRVFRDLPPGVHVVT
jgi:hypothetical protein